MFLIRNQFNLTNIEEQIRSNKESWFNDIYGIDILNSDEVLSFINEISLSERHNFLNDMARWIKSISPAVNLKRCSFEISFIEEVNNEIFLSSFKNKEVKFVIVKYVFINNEYYVYIGNVEDTTFIKI